MRIVYGAIAMIKRTFKEAVALAKRYVYLNPSIPGSSDSSYWCSALICALTGIPIGDKEMIPPAAHEAYELAERINQGTAEATSSDLLEELEVGDRAKESSDVTAQDKPPVLFTATLMVDGQATETREFYSLEEFREADMQCQDMDAIAYWTLDYLQLRYNGRVDFEVVRQGVSLGRVCHSGRRGWQNSISGEADNKSYEDPAGAMVEVLRSHGIGVEKGRIAPHSG